LVVVVMIDYTPFPCFSFSLQLEIIHGILVQVWDGWRINKGRRVMWIVEFSCFGEFEDRPGADGEKRRINHR
jgi:hypothetical protein